MKAKIISLGLITVLLICLFSIPQSHATILTSFKTSYLSLVYENGTVKKIYTSYKDPAGISIALPKLGFNKTLYINPKGYIKGGLGLTSIETNALIAAPPIPSIDPISDDEDNGGAGPDDDGDGSGGSDGGGDDGFIATPDDNGGFGPGGYVN